MNPPIVLLTDFGHKDHYVGVIKGVIHSIAPQAPIIDLCHEVPPQDIRSGAYLLGVSYRFFPKGTIFLSVVDPGVGTNRRIIIVRLGDWYFVNPDNGLLTLVMEREKLKQAIQVTESRYWLSPVSSTFHGRDIMSPVAAHLYRNSQPKKFGRSIKAGARPAVPLLRLSTKPAAKGEKTIEGEVFYIDHFGNLVTNIPSRMIPENCQCRVSIAHKKLHRIVRSYGDAAIGEWVAVVASADLLEIAVNQGNAQKELQAKVGDPVRVEWE